VGEKRTERGREKSVGKFEICGEREKSLGGREKSGEMTNINRDKKRYVKNKNIVKSQIG